MAHRAGWWRSAAGAESTRTGASRTPRSTRTGASSMARSTRPGTSSGRVIGRLRGESARTGAGWGCFETRARGGRGAGGPDGRRDRGTAPTSLVQRKRPSELLDAAAHARANGLVIRGVEDVGHEAADDLEFLGAEA